MKLPLALSLLLTTSAFAKPLHLDLEMTSKEYTALLKKLKLDKIFKKKKGASQGNEASIDHAIAMGQRLSKWITNINATRTSNAIRLTSPNTRSGISIDKPKFYSPTTVKESIDKLMVNIPEEMKTVILGTSDLPSTTSLDDETFIKFGREVDKIYQTAARYKSLDQWRNEYIQLAARDVRGYHFFKTNNLDEKDLARTGNIPVGKRKEVKNALVLMCLNSGTVRKACEKEVSKAYLLNNLDQVYAKYISAAKEIWDSFYNIPDEGVRKDIAWKNNTATIPFQTPTIAKFVPYLRDNLEDEWKWKGWQLRLNFGTFDVAPYLKFETGVVPHVNEIGGNEITMDDNQPIEEYESQWTIRHEFGHVLGFPDCYHEFYDTTLNAYVNYQLDTTDLMCSRAGNMNERLYLEMKRRYEK